MSDLTIELNPLISLGLFGFLLLAGGGILAAGISLCIRADKWRPVTFTGQMQDAPDRVFGIERYPGESREQFEVRRRGSVQ